jgi:hypothetical protein
MMQAWADYLDSLRTQTEIASTQRAGEQAALTGMEAFQHAESDGPLSFQAQAMATLHAILSLGRRR